MTALDTVLQGDAVSRLVAALLLSPNLVALARHGTTDLLAAHGYTMEEWIEERRAS